jgi:hypothetical protein
MMPLDQVGLIKSMQDYALKAEQNTISDFIIPEMIKRQSKKMPEKSEFEPEWTKFVKEWFPKHSKTEINPMPLEPLINPGGLLPPRPLDHPAGTIEMGPLDHPAGTMDFGPLDHPMGEMPMGPLDHPGEVQQPKVLASESSAEGKVWYHGGAKGLEGDIIAGMVTRSKEEAQRYADEVGGSVYEIPNEAVVVAGPKDTGADGQSLGQNYENYGFIKSVPKGKKGWDAKLSPIQSAEGKVDPLTESARKAVAEGKTVGEFVAGQGKVYYHGSDKYTSGELKKTLTPDDFVKGVSITSSSDLAKIYGKVHEIYAKDLNLIDARDLMDMEIWEKDLSPKQLENALKKLGYDGIDWESLPETLGGGHGISVFNTEKLKTAADLRTAYDKAKAEAPSAEGKPRKTT